MSEIERILTAKEKKNKKKKVSKSFLSKNKKLFKIKISKITAN